jgi:hypothetical protein
MRNITWWDVLDTLLQRWRLMHTCTADDSELRMWSCISRVFRRMQTESLSGLIFSRFLSIHQTHTVPFLSEQCEVKRGRWWMWHTAVNLRSHNNYWCSFCDVSSVLVWAVGETRAEGCDAKWQGLYGSNPSINCLSVNTVQTFNTANNKLSLWIACWPPIGKSHVPPVTLSSWSLSPSRSLRRTYALDTPAARLSFAYFRGSLTLEDRGGTFLRNVGNR